MLPGELCNGTRSIPRLNIQSGPSEIMPYVHPHILKNKYIRSISTETPSVHGVSTGKLHIPHRCLLPLPGYTILLDESLSEGPWMGSLPVLLGVVIADECIHNTTSATIYYSTVQSRQAISDTLPVHNVWHSCVRHQCMVLYMYACRWLCNMGQ